MTRGGPSGTIFQKYRHDSVTIKINTTFVQHVWGGIFKKTLICPLVACFNNSINLNCAFLYNLY